MVDKGAIEHEEDNEGNKDKDGGVDEEEEEDGSHTSDTTLSQPAVTLERILLAYDAEQALYKIEEENPRPENQSASTLLRPVDYDSVGRRESCCVLYLYSAIITVLYLLLLFFWCTVVL